MSETQKYMCEFSKKTRMFLGLWHWSVTNKCLQYAQTYYHHSIQIEFGVQGWIRHVLHNHDSTTHIRNLNESIMLLDLCCHSYAFQKYVHVAGEMQVS